MEEPRQHQRHSRRAGMDPELSGSQPVNPFMIRVRYYRAERGQRNTGIRSNRTDRKKQPCHAAGFNANLLRMKPLEAQPSTTSAASIRSMRWYFGTFKFHVAQSDNSPTSKPVSFRCDRATAR